MKARFCPQCGQTIYPSSNFCSQCGAAIEPPVRYIIPMWRVILMTILSGGLYIFYWFYITWKQYRDHTDNEAYPIWHSLTLLVPIYNWFRIHAHMRTYKELMSSLHLATSIRPGISVVALYVSLFLENMAFPVTEIFNYDREITQEYAITALVVSLITVTITTWLLTSVQANINRYWRASLPHTSACRIGIGEVIFAIIGVWLWTDTILSVVSQSYRLA